VIGEYIFDGEGGRHQAFYSPIRNTVVMGELIRPHDRILVEQSLKYSPLEAEKLWSSAGMMEVGHWKHRDHGEFCLIFACYRLLSHPEKFFLGEAFDILRNRITTIPSSPHAPPTRGTSQWYERRGIQQTCGLAFSDGVVLRGFGSPHYGQSRESIDIYGELIRDKSIILTNSLIVYLSL
jgi:hypothetical protein